MLIVCPSCTAGYNIDAAKLGEGGRNVRCAACSTQWFVTPEPQIAAEAELTPVPDSLAVAAPPPADPFDEEAMAREWANAESWTPEPEPPPATPDAEASAIEAPDEPEPDAHAAGAAALAAAAAAAASARTPWWRRMLPTRRAKAAKEAAQPAPAPAPALARRKTAAPSGKGRAARLAGALRSPVAAGLAGFALIGGLLWQREAVVRHAPSSAPLFAALGLPVNLSGLVFADVRSTVSREAQGRFLTVEGRIRSVAAGNVAVPTIEISIRGEDGRGVYTWTADPPRRTLRAGESLHFRTRLATPPEAGRDVEVRFADTARSAAARN